MKRYLKRTIKEGINHDIEDRPSCQLLKQICDSFECNSIIYSFNYTPLERYARFFNTHYNRDIFRYPHGEYNGNIILGIETDDIDSIAPGYSFLLKSNHKMFNPLNISQVLQHAKNVVFFGHSINKMDFLYFKEYFSKVMTENDYSKTCTFITKDDESRIAIKDNLRRFHIVPMIEVKIKMDFILTDNLKDEKSEDRKKFDMLLLNI